jgi:ribosomal protein S12 methylthiotransferase
MISLGCAKNLVDSEVMLGELRARGHEITSELDGAQTVIVNTCAFIDEAKRESIETILEVAQRKGKGVERLIVAGCMVNRYAAELRADIPEIDGFITLDQLRQAPELVALGGDAAVPASGPSNGVFDHTAPRLVTTPGYAYLKVAEGCNNPCTFCAIPLWRGQFRSRTIDSLVQEARGLRAGGANELCLVAQDTTRYGEDLGLGKHGLLRLVEALLARTDFPWIRFLYAYPTTLDEDLLRLMGQEPRFLSYIDMPLQHSHPEMLKAMRRGGSPERYLRLLDRARTLAPDVFLRSTFIVGFPGETEEHFAHLLDFVSQARFDHLGCFVYSPEEGTPSAELKGRVSRATAERRQKKLMKAQEPHLLASRKALVGKMLPGLIEGPCEETEHLLQGRHYGMSPDIDGRLLINDGLEEVGPQATRPGTIVQVEITDAFATDLVGRVVKVLHAASARNLEFASPSGVDGIAESLPR